MCPRKHILGQIWPFLGPKILIFMGGRKSFVTHTTEIKTPKHLFRIVFWSAMGPNGPKMPISCQESIFGPKILIPLGVSKSFFTHITENHLGNLFALFFGRALDQLGQECQYLAKNASFGQNLDVFKADGVKLLVIS